MFQPGCIDKFQKDTQRIIELVARDSAEKGLSEEAVKLFDLAKVSFSSALVRSPLFHFVFVWLFVCFLFFLRNWLSYDSYLLFQGGSKGFFFALRFMK